MKSSEVIKAWKKDRKTNTEKVTPQILDQAKAIGRKAYQNDTGLIPAQNSKLMDLIESLHLEIGGGALEIMTAFTDEIRRLTDEEFAKTFVW